MSTLVAKARLYTWGALQTIRLGRPQATLGFLGGIGDDLLCTAPIYEWLQRGVKRIWFCTRHPGLFPELAADPRIRLVPDQPRYLQLAARLGQPMRPLSYSHYEAEHDRDSPLSEHIVTAMCRRAGLTGRVALRPRLAITPSERSAQTTWAGCIAVQTSSLVASVPMLNKQWPADRMQALVNRFSGQARFIQIGSVADPALSGVDDLRGRTSLRATAAILAQTRLFVGIPGFLMHLARAVECRAVIVYGGREPAELTGYRCNINLAELPPCAPCWQRNRCDHGRVCTDAIPADRVATAVAAALAAPRSPLSEETADL